MKLLSARAHGIVDYAAGVLLIASPWLFGFSAVTNAMATMVAVGVVVLFISLVTDYPLGVIKALPFPTHGVLESIGAVGLLLSPWLIGFVEIEAARIVALAVGIAWLGLVFLTDYISVQRHHPSH